MAPALHLFLNNPLHSRVNLILFPSFSRAANLFIVANAPIKQKNYFLPWALLGKSDIHTAEQAIAAGHGHACTNQTTYELKTHFRSIRLLHFLTGRKTNDPRDMAPQVNSFSGCYEPWRFGENGKFRAEGHSHSYHLGTAAQAPLLLTAVLRWPGRTLA